MSDAAVDITEHDDAQRIELRVDGELAGWLDHRGGGDALVLAHTEVLDQHEGQGLGGQLVRYAIEMAERRGQHVMPTCPFALA